MVVDFEKMTAHLGGMLASAAIAGQVPVGTESGYDKWLQSDLLSQGLEDELTMVETLSYQSET